MIYSTEITDQLKAQVGEDGSAARPLKLNSYSSSTAYKAPTPPLY